MTEPNPLSPEEAPGIQLVVQLRIYDVLMALLTDQSPGKAKELLELHRQGILLGPSPHLTGQFVTDEQNSSVTDEQAQP